MTKLSTFLIGEREKRGWSRQDLADKSGIPYTTISRWERPPTRKKPPQPDHENIQALARVFEMHASRVLSLIGYPVRESSSDDEREQRWIDIRKSIESDPRAERVIELFEEADESEKDTALTILEAHLSHRRRRRR